MGWDEAASGPGTISADVRKAMTSCLVSRSISLRCVERSEGWAGPALAPGWFLRASFGIHPQARQRVAGHWRLDLGTKMRNFVFGATRLRHFRSRNSAGSSLSGWSCEDACGPSEGREFTIRADWSPYRPVRRMAHPAMIRASKAKVADGN